MLEKMLCLQWIHSSRGFWLFRIQAKWRFLYIEFHHMRHLFFLFIYFIYLYLYLDLGFYSIVYFMVFADKCYWNKHSRTCKTALLVDGGRVQHSEYWSSLWYGTCTWHSTKARRITSWRKCLSILDGAVVRILSELLCLSWKVDMLFNLEVANVCTSKITS